VGRHPLFKSYIQAALKHQAERTDQLEKVAA
jgi:hypothetical protein